MLMLMVSCMWYRRKLRMNVGSYEVTWCHNLAWCDYTWVIEYALPFNRTMPSTQKLGQRSAQSNMLSYLLPALLLPLYILAIPFHDRQHALTLSSLSRSPATFPSPRPLVIWHGLGDTALSSGISSFISDIEGFFPGIFVWSVKVPEGRSLDQERRAGFVSVGWRCDGDTGNCSEWVGGLKVSFLIRYVGV